MDTTTPPAPDHGSVLVVDDDEMVRELIRAGLEARGLTVVTAATGAEALSTLLVRAPDLVLSDITMPDMDGFALVSRLRADPLTRSLPLIFLTSRVEAADAVTGLRLGADDYIRKPFELDEVVARVEARLQRRPVPVDQLVLDPRTGVLLGDRFVSELERESGRARRSARPGAVAIIDLDERRTVRKRFGARADDELASRMMPLLTTEPGELELLGRDPSGAFLLLLPETTQAVVEGRLLDLAARIATEPFVVAGEHVDVTPTIGWAAFGIDATPAPELMRRARLAGEVAGDHLDLRPVAWSPRLESEHRPRERGALWQRIRACLGAPLQIAATFVLGIVIPFFVQVGLYRAGFDISTVVYLAVVVALVITAASIWTEGFLAVDPERPPSEPGEASRPSPPASAIIAAYLPNEAATVIETVEAVLRADYPDLQVILAYNSPRRLPVERLLHELAARDPRFVPLEVVGSTSKAQNVNAALAHVTGEFVGVFDADHHPAPDAFHRAWRWLSNGYDVVQGHCVVRNGDASWVSRTVAVEFEAIYAVSHPGRARLHGFGIFGGSNGYWRTSVLRATRMHGFMLTEDIDSSLRIIEDGGRIASDPALLSRELAPTTVGQLWNQRMRWAQGWFQVSVKHFRRGWASPHLRLRQKLGLSFLLGWREVYPWISAQIIPLLAFFAWRDGGIAHLDWFVSVFVLTTLFTFSVGPGQALFAYRLAAPEIRQHRGWFLGYFFVSSLVYSEWKNVIGRVAQIKEIAGDRQWKVTPRTTAVREGDSS